jgi:hypothetical protein
MAKFVQIKDLAASKRKASAEAEAFFSSAFIIAV